MDYQVVIVGGGPAAHSAGLVFGRSRVRVLICDEGMPRNRVAAHSHSFFTRDGAPPLELRQIGIDQLSSYETVTFVRDRVVEIEKTSGGFRASFDGRAPVTTGLVLLAVGMVDKHLDAPGFESLWGDTVIHCPYCHGWEVRDLPWAAYLTTPGPVAMLPRLRSWSDDVIVIVDPGLSLSSDQERQLAKAGYPIERGTIKALHATDGRLDSIELGDGRRISRKVLLFSPQQSQTALVQRLGPQLDEAGYVVTDDMGQTSIEGIYAAGDLITPRQQIGIAAANGLVTAIAMHGVLSAQ
jgi:thioredoxin reductase